MNANVEDSIEMARNHLDTASKLLEQARYELFRVEHRFGYVDGELDNLLYRVAEQRDAARSTRDYLGQYLLAKGKLT